MSLIRRGHPDDYDDDGRYNPGPGSETAFQALALCRIADHLENIDESLRALRKGNRHA